MFRALYRWHLCRVRRTRKRSRNLAVIDCIISNKIELRGHRQPCGFRQCTGRISGLASFRNSQKLHRPVRYLGWKRRTIGFSGLAPATLRPVMRASTDVECLSPVFFYWFYRTKACIFVRHQEYAFTFRRICIRHQGSNCVPLIHHPKS